MASVQTNQRRRTTRQRRADTEATIVAVTGELLVERPWRDLAVEDVAAAAGMSRTAFYRFFPDLVAVIERVATQIAAELFELSQAWWTPSDEPPSDLRPALTGIVDAFRRLGPIILAVQAAAIQDADLDALYLDIIGQFATAVTERITADQATGFIPTHLDPAQTARALVWMTERYLSEAYRYPGEADDQASIDTLTNVWAATLYPASILHDGQTAS